MNGMLVRFGILQIALVLLTMWVAAQKNRNAGGWGLAALFFPLVALIVLVALPPLAPNATLDPAQRDPLPVCNQCGHVTAEPGARYCAACGAALGSRRSS
jgi:hypothetical protein